MRENVIWKTWPHARVKLRARLAVFGKMNIYHVRRYSPGGMAAGRKTVRTLKIRRRKSSLSALLTRMGTTFWSWELPWSRRTPWSPARWKRLQGRWATRESHTVEYFNTSELFWIIFKQPLECHAGSTRDKPSHQERDWIGAIGGEVEGARRQGGLSHDVDSLYWQEIHLLNQIQFKEYPLI